MSAREADVCAHAELPQRREGAATVVAELHGDDLDWTDVHETTTLSGIDDRRRASAASPLVLVVDDNTDARDLEAEFLAFLGCRVLVASTGEEALRIAPVVRPDLIVMDMSMPRMDGIEAATRLRADRRTAGTPIVAVTGFGESWEPRAREAGCNAFLEKPLDLHRFEATARELLPTLGSAGR